MFTQQDERVLAWQKVGKFWVPQRLTVKDPAEGTESVYSFVNYRINGRAHQPQSQTDSEDQNEETRRRATGLGITRAEVGYHLGSVIRLERSTPVDGRERQEGKSDDETLALEVIGKSSNVYSATLLAGFPSDSEEVRLRNLAFTIRFLKNCVPEWDDTLRAQWIGAAVRDLSWTPGKTLQETRGNKVVVARGVTQGGIRFTVKPR